MERREPSEQLKRVLEEVGLNAELFLQRLFFAMWMDDGYTLDEIVSNYFYYPTLAVPCEKTLQRWRKLWLENDFHLQDSRSGSSKPRDLVHSAVLEEFAKDPNQSARVTSRTPSQMLFLTVCRTPSRMLLPSWRVFRRNS